MNYWFITFSHDKAPQNNEYNFGWQNPVVYIEKGFSQVLTGDFHGYVDIQIDDKIYIYSGQKNGQPDTNGLYGVGTVCDILVGQKQPPNEHAVIKLEKQGTENSPLVAYSKDKALFKCLYNAARPKYGFCEMTMNEVSILDGLIIKWSP